MTIKKRITTFLLVLVVILAIGGELLLSLFAVRASAAEGTSTTYSNVLDDLKKDSSFNPADYPDKPDDYSLSVIQVAEGENGELFVYVYQPSNATKDLRASKINMSLQDPTVNNASGEVANSLYNLTWLNSNGVFDKYLVNDFIVSDEAYRYYTIATIYRVFDGSIDTSNVGEGELTNYIGCSVGKSYCCYYYNSVLITECVEFEVVDIDIQHVGFFEYDEGFKLYSDRCRSHYVAFSIENFAVDKIYDADITYTYQTVSIEMKLTIETVTKGELTTVTEYLSDKDTGSNKADGWFSRKYEWNRISDITSFIEEVEGDLNEEIDNDLKTLLLQSDFVFRFLETDWSAFSNTNDQYFEDYTDVTDVAILRLHFLSDGKTYNLGVVSDIVTGKDNADGYVSTLDNIQNNLEEGIEWLKMTVMIVALIAIILIFFKPVKAFCKLIWSGIKFLFNLMVGFLTLPFKIILFFFR